MTYLVGLSSDQGGEEALNLAVTLARLARTRLVVCTIVPEGWQHPSPARVDYEYDRFLREHAERTLETARATVPEDMEAEFVVRRAGSAARGLISTAGDIGADYIVLGSTLSAPPGRFSEGATTTEVLHGAPMPVVLAPRGGIAAGVSVRRVSCAISGAAQSQAIAERAGEVAGEFGVGLRLITLVTRENQMHPTGAGLHAEHLVAGEFRRQAEAMHQQIIDGWKSPVPVSAAIGSGPGLKEALDALDWEETELLVIGSSGFGPVLKVFLGSNSGRIARLAPVPRVILPRWSDQGV